MNIANKLLFSVIYITLIFPYINIGLSEVGTQPVFHVAILLFFTIFSLNKTLLIIFVIFILTFLEMLFLRYFNYQTNNIDIFKITALTLVIAFKHLANKFLLINSNLKNYSLIEIVPIGLFALMFILFLFGQNEASSFNKILVGANYHEGLVGITYFSNEPGLASFGIFTFFTLLFFKVKRDSTISTYLSLIAIILLISTGSGTGLVLAIILIILNLNNKKILFLLCILFFTFQFINLKSGFLDHSIDRIEQLMNINNNVESSPALRIKNILDLEDNFQYFYNQRANGVDHGVGFVSYLTIIPVTTCFFIIYCLLNINIIYIPLFIFSIIMLPLSSPFIFTLFLMSKYKEILKKNDKSCLNFNYKSN